MQCPVPSHNIWHKRHLPPTMSTRYNTDMSSCSLILRLRRSVVGRLLLQALAATATFHKLSEGQPLPASPWDAPQSISSLGLRNGCDRTRPSPSCKPSDTTGQWPLTQTPLT